MAILGAGINLTFGNPRLPPGAMISLRSLLRFTFNPFGVVRFKLLLLGQKSAIYDGAKYKFIVLVCLIRLGTKFVVRVLMITDN